VVGKKKNQKNGGRKPQISGAMPKSHTSRKNLKLYIMGFAIVFYVAIIVLLIASMWTVYTKAGKPGWAAIIPIYNIIILLEIVGKPTWWVVLYFIPIVNIVISIMVYHQLSLSFGKDTGFTVGLVLLGIVFFPILAFSDAKYIGPVGESSN